MTRERAKELLPVIEAFANGETIQSNFNGVWEENKNPDWSALGESYRIKPQPRKVWINEYTTMSTGAVVFGGIGYPSKELADAPLNASNRIACHEIEIPPL